MGQASSIESQLKRSRSNKMADLYLKELQDLLEIRDGVLVHREEQNDS